MFRIPKRAAQVLLSPKLDERYVSETLIDFSERCDRVLYDTVSHLNFCSILFDFLSFDTLSHRLSVYLVTR